ncbi:N-acetyltransferase [Nonomuraea aridisoli]|uniref:N-acetyltransferase n=2 Tax=Nonomuraea aridisoli TaxID=2070368 RepID=A0A2W2FGZ3_9ACTN|nr:N-acetyltransferase [Nonomuraea aridisoli]
MKTTVPFGLAEQTEIRSYAGFVAAPTAIRTTLGISSLRVGSVDAIAMRRHPSFLFNRVGGFETSESITVDVVAQMCDFYREQGPGAGAFIIAPPLLPPDWASIAAKLNLTEGGRFHKLWCETRSALSAPDGIAALDPGLRVGPIEPHHAHEWATVMMTTFGMPMPDMIDLAASNVGKPNWRQYAVWDDERIVAVGSLFINGECANMFGGATLPESRGRGAQSALLTARVQAAQAAGCRWLVAETGVEGPGDHNSSLHNMLRAGFERLYDRTNWIWRA